MSTPAEAIIDKFGGLTKMANAIGFRVSTVQGWKERGRIPQDHWPAIRLAATEKGFEIALDEFVTVPASTENAA